jgi:putative endonuclease
MAQPMPLFRWPRKAPIATTPAASLAPDGAAWEGIARMELERAGLRWRAANVRYRFGEIDLVMDDADVLVFVEVRYRRSGKFGGGIESVDRRKQGRLARAAAAYLAAEPALARRACRFDVVALSGSSANYRMEWIRNAFTLDET